MKKLNGLSMKAVFAIVLILSTFLNSIHCNAQAGFEVKAFHLDMRAEVMTTDALYALADRLAGQGVNAIVMEYEAAFPFDDNAVLCKKTAYTKEEVTGFVNHCAGLGIDVIPLQNCFGHCEYILRHDRYKALREDKKDRSQVCPMRLEEAKEIFADIFKEVAALHPSKYFHIGADETRLLGHCKACKAFVEKYGESKLFVDYVSAMCEIVKSLGKTPVIWADMILKYPEALSQLPEDLVFVDWNYGWKPDHFGKLENLLSHGATIWGAAALRASPDNMYLTQWKVHFDNIRDFVAFARKNGYKGMVQTSWSTSGQYGYIYDRGFEVVDIQPVRLVYPMSAFAILEDAFCQALGSKEKFNPEAFVRDYATRKMGLDEAGAGLLWKYFSMEQNYIVTGPDKVTDSAGKGIDSLISECEDMKKGLSALKPRDHKEEFRHWVLMLDIRLNYLKFKKIEGVYQSSDYNGSMAGELLRELEPVLAEEKRLDKRFRRLNKGYLKAEEIVYCNGMRSLKAGKLYEVLSVRH